MCKYVSWMLNGPYLFTQITSYKYYSDTKGTNGRKTHY